MHTVRHQLTGTEPEFQIAGGLRPYFKYVGPNFCTTVDPVLRDHPMEGQKVVS